MMPYILGAPRQPWKQDAHAQNLRQNKATATTQTVPFEIYGHAVGVPIILLLKVKTEISLKITIFAESVSVFAEIVSVYARRC
jgi:hypothetical protein